MYRVEFDAKWWEYSPFERSRTPSTRPSSLPSYSFLSSQCFCSHHPLLHAVLLSWGEYTDGETSSRVSHRAPVCAPVLGEQPIACVSMVR